MAVISQIECDFERLRSLLIALGSSADESMLIEFVKASRRILDAASAMGLERLSNSARKLVELGQDCFPVQMNFVRGAYLQLCDTLIELQVDLFELKFGDPYPLGSSPPAERR